MPKCIAIYSRKSKFTGKGESIENQIELCKQYIEKHYTEDNLLEIVVYEDEGFSGKNTARPQFKKMLQDAKKKKFTVLVCYRLDRISRNVGDFANLIEDLKKLGVDFISIREAFDTSNPMGRAMMYIASVFAQLERETIAERIRDNMYELSKTGRWLGGTTPTGYQSESIEKVAVDGKVRKAFKLKLIQEEAQIIMKIFDLYLETGSLTKTDAFLVQNNYTTKNNIYFNRFSIRSILTNPVYLIADEDAYYYIINHKMDLFSEEKDFDGRHGIMAYNRTFQKEGAAHQYRNMEEWIVSVGKHEGIISGHKWVKVQELLELNKSKSYKKPRSNVALLSGLLFCGGCGSYMRPKLTRRYTPSGERIYDYLCTMKEKSNCSCCNMKNPNGNLLDSKISEELHKLSQDWPTYYENMDKLLKIVLLNKNDRSTERDHLKKMMKDYEKEIHSLVNTLTRIPEITVEQYILKQIEENHKRIEELKSKINEIEIKSSKNSRLDLDVITTKEKVMDFGSCYEEASVDQKRDTIRTLVKKVVWDGEDIHLFYHCQEPQCEDSK